MPERTSDELLLEKAGTGDATAFLEIYQRYRAPVFQFAYRLSASAETAEDLTHDCFLALIKKPSNFDPSRGALKTYLFSAARNLWLKQLRKLGRETSLEDFEDGHFLAPVRSPSHLLLAEELSAMVKDAVASLPPLQREALVLFEYEGLSLKEIADIAETDVGAIKARLYRAREGLKIALRPSLLNSNREIVTLEKGLR